MSRERADALWAPRIAMHDPGQHPLVTIGVPAFNSGRFVRQSLDSLVRQDYPNLEIVISDDGSTDGTTEICEELARRDDRITFHRRSHLGERRNFNSLLGMARGTYFMWAADHDVWDSRYISSCVAALESDGAAVLAYSHTMSIDEDGHELGIMDDELGIHQERSVDRYRALIWRLTWCNAIYGVMRRQAVTATGGYGPTPSPDHLVLARMALQGTFLQLDEPLFYRRQNRPPETLDEMRHRQSHDLDPQQAEAWLTMPRGSFYRSLRNSHLKTVLRERWPAREKMLAATSTIACFAERFGVSSRMLRTAGRAARLLPASLRARLSGPS